VQVSKKRKAAELDVAPTVTGNNSEAQDAHAIAAFKAARRDQGTAVLATVLSNALRIDVPMRAEKDKILPQAETGSPTSDHSDQTPGAGDDASFRTPFKYYRQHGGVAAEGADGSEGKASSGLVRMGGWHKTDSKPATSTRLALPFPIVRKRVGKRAAELRAAQERDSKCGKFE
jgi:hypothetical protein